MSHVICPAATASGAAFETRAAARPVPLALADEAEPAAVPAAALAALLHHAQRLQAAASVAELGFVLTNETLALLPYRQAAFFTAGPGGRLQLATASGLASVASDSPFAVWLTRFAQHWPQTAGGDALAFADAAQQHPDFAEGWAEWLPDHLLLLPLHAPDGERLGLLMLARDAACSAAEQAVLASAQGQAAYCLWSVGRQHQGLRRRLGRTLRHRWLTWGAPALLLALLIPVRLSALAPAEVVAFHALAVAAPQDGVVARFHVQPNAPVQAGDLLFSLDDTALKSRRDVAAKSLEIARADALVAQQRAFDDVKSKGELAAAFGRVREKESELAQVETALARVDVRADRPGVALFGDTNDWLGRPVQTGERVLQLADPKDASVLVWLPAADALNLDAGAPLRLFLHTRPLQPLSGQVLQTSYEAVSSPEGIASYRLRGRFDADAGTPRIGLRGTARVSGDWSVLGYYVLRRPLAALREWTGL